MKQKPPVTPEIGPSWREIINREDDLHQQEYDAAANYKVVKVFDWQAVKKFFQVLRDRKKAR